MAEKLYTAFNDKTVKCFPKMRNSLTKLQVSEIRHYYNPKRALAARPPAGGHEMYALYHQLLATKCTH